MERIHFRLAAFTDAAGRLDTDAPRHGNEDNLFVNAMLGSPVEESFFQLDKDTVLSEFGCILVVADGMGGMNAGEVASEIAVQVVRNAFVPDQMQESFKDDRVSRERYLCQVVEMADSAIKEHASLHPECEGMGSTITMLWLCGNEASIAWCGDSRIYLFREPDGFRQISKDHSYVQELIDAGKLTEEEAFHHPYNNIITRSLGDASKKAVADVLTIPAYKGDIFLLNSDGLSGVLHDDEMEEIIRNNRQSMSACRVALWEAAQEAGWYDNVTAILCEITEGEEPIRYSLATTLNSDTAPVHYQKKRPWLVAMIIGILTFAAISFFVIWNWRSKTLPSAETDTLVASDSVDFTGNPSLSPDADAADISEPMHGEMI